MKQYQGFAKRFLLLTASFFASSILITSPSLAATFASSEATLDFTNFSQSPSDTSVSTNANTVTIAKDSIVQAMAEAFAEFTNTPPRASNSSLSQALGQRNGVLDPESFYLGLAQSEATLIGNFDVEAGKTFTFDFTASLNERTLATDLLEEAFSSGNISWVLLNTANNRTLELFNLAGNLITQGEGDFLSIQKSDHVTLNIPTKDFSFGGPQEFVTVAVQGSLQRSFPEETKLALVEVKNTQASVRTVPEPSTSLAILLSLGGMSLALKARRKLS